MRKLLFIIYILFYFLLNINFISSQTACTSNDDCASIVPGPCEAEYICNTDINFCEPTQAECYNGQRCYDEACQNDELRCVERYCSGNICYDDHYRCNMTDDRLCFYIDCTVDSGCIPRPNSCRDTDPCTEDLCDEEQGCYHVPIPNCLACMEVACIQTDLCEYYTCLEYPSRGGVEGGCVPHTINCTTDDPCLINGRCVMGECIYDNICSSEETATQVVTTISQTTTTPTTSPSTVSTIEVTTFGTCSTGENSEEYRGPLYPNCLNCDDLNCLKMGKKCKYIKSLDFNNCFKDHHIEKDDHHHKKGNHHHWNNNHHFNHQKYGGGYGGIDETINKDSDHGKYPKRLSKEDCCPYTATCY